MIDGGVEVLQDERHAGPFAEIGDAVQRVPRLQPHRPGDLVRRLHRQAAAVKAGAVQVQARDAEPLGDRDRLFRRAEQLVPPRHR